MSKIDMYKYISIQSVYLYNIGKKFYDNYILLNFAKMWVHDSIDNTEMSYSTYLLAGTHNLTYYCENHEIVCSETHVLVN